MSKGLVSLMSPRSETELLLCCAQSSMSAERTGRVRALLGEDIDWAYLLQTAHRHRLIPLLYQNLSTICPEAVPRATLNQLKRYFHINGLNNRFLTKELLRLLSLFEANGVLAVPYKGPVLAAAVYGHLALRVFDDLDVLIHKRDLLKAKELLITDGYQLALTQAQEAFFLKNRYHYHFVHANDKVHVELHWAFTRSYWTFPLTLAHLQKRLESVSLAGTTVPSIAVEDLLLILCAHGAKHHWERLGWICDVAELIRVHHAIDWEHMLEQAIRLHSMRILLLGLLLAQELLNAPLPEEVCRKIQTDSGVKSLVTQVREQLFSEAEGTHFNPHDFYLQLRERLPDRVRYLRYYYVQQMLPRVFTPNAKDRASLSLPASLSFLYYLLRPIRLAREYALSRLRR
jgi:hypothetical protein